MAGLVNLDLGSILSGAGSLAKDIRTAITGKDPALAADLEKKILEIEGAINTAQSAINQAEAQNPSIFVSGWRPLIGWVGGTALALHFLVRPLVAWAGAVFGVSIPFPEFDLSQLWPLVTGMLGIAGMRSFEKVKGAAK